jgi:hypothetical protein
VDSSAVTTWITKQEISETLHKYPIALDSLDRDLLLSIGHPTGRVNFDGMFEGTWPAFVEWVLPAHEPLLFHNHRITNMLIELDGDTARSQTNVTATLLIAQKDGDVDERRIQARYLDRLARYQDRWVIAERELARDLRVTSRLSAADFKARYIVSPDRRRTHG